jgi:hypothetical protein
VDVLLLVTVSETKAGVEMLLLKTGSPDGSSSVLVKYRQPVVQEPSLVHVTLTVTRYSSVVVADEVGPHRPVEASFQQTPMKVNSE